MVVSFFLVFAWVSIGLLGTLVLFGVFTSLFHFFEFCVKLGYKWRRK